MREVFTTEIVGVDDTDTITRVKRFIDGRLLSTMDCYTRDTAYFIDALRSELIVVDGEKEIG